MAVAITPRRYFIAPSTKKAIEPFQAMSRD